MGGALEEKSAVAERIDKVASRSSNYFVRLFSDMRLYLVLVGLVFVYHSSIFGDYLIDDALISLSYARNFAEGHGFVLTPGGEKVEGFSNFLWVIILSIPYKLGLGTLDPIWILKPFGIFFGLATIVVIFFLPLKIYNLRKRDPILLFAPLALSISTPFVHWSTAGLENPFYSFLIVLSTYLYVMEIRNPKQFPWSSITLSGVALTRPEGVIYFVVILIHRTISMVWYRKLPTWRDGIWFLLFVFLYGSFLIWRYTYFGYWVPNTFYAKASSRHLTELLEYLLAIKSGGWQYVISFFLQKGIIPLSIFILIALLERKYILYNIFFVGILSSTFLYIIYVDGDWWQEYRFIAAVIPFIYILISRGIWQSISCLSKINRQKRMTVISAITVTIFALITIFQTNMRSSADVGLQVGAAGIQSRGELFKYYAEQANLEKATYLEPDVGGTSYFSGLTIIDLAMLADIHLARFHYYQPFFKEYIFQEQRPELIHTHGWWSNRAHWQDYVEFKNDYLPIQQERTHWGIEGHFIRKDLFVIDSLPTDRQLQDVVFGRLRLLGFSTKTPVAFPGQTVEFEWYWQCLNLCTEDHILMLNLRHSTQNGIIQQEFTPVFGWYPTSHWKAGEIVHTTREIKIPDNTPEGPYTIFIGVTTAEKRNLTSYPVGQISIGTRIASEQALQHFQKHEILYDSEQWQEALQAIEIASLLQPSNEEYIRAIEETRSSWQLALFRDAEKLLEEGKEEQAVAMSVQARKLGEISNEGKKIQKVIRNYFFHRGEQHFSDYHYEDAFTSFLQALNVDPSYVWARHRLEDAREMKDSYYCSEEKKYQALLDKLEKGVVPDAREAEDLFFCLRETADSATLSKLQGLFEGNIPRNLDLSLYENDTPVLRVIGYRFRTLDPVIMIQTYFEVLSPISKDYVIWMHGHVTDTTILPPGRQQYGFDNFDHRPGLPTSQWPTGEIYRHSYAIHANPGEYRLSFGFWLPEGYRLETQSGDTGIDIGWHEIRHPQSPAPIATSDEVPGDAGAITPTLPLSTATSTGGFPINIDAVLYQEGTPVLQATGYQTKVVAGGLQVDIAFNVLGKLDHDYIIWMHGHVTDTTILPPGRQQHGFDNFDHRPELPTSQWPVGSVYLHSYTIHANPGEYRLSFGFWLSEGYRLRTQSGDTGIDIGWHEIPPE
jgi:tetratricopeptide (TPR) repeat protein